MALCLISRSVGGVIILGVKGDGDVRDFSPGSTSFYPVHREGGELIDFGFSGCQHQKAKIRERSEEHTSELQSLMRISYAVFCLKKRQCSSRSGGLVCEKRNILCPPILWCPRHQPPACTYR